MIPNRDHSTESVRIMFSTAARAAPEWTMPGIPWWGEGDAEHLAAPLRYERLGRGGMGHEPGPGDVELDHGPEALRRDRLRRAQELAARVVDQQVELSVALEHAIDEPLDRLVVADVHRLGLRVAPRRLHLGDHLRQRLGAPPAADHGRAEPRQLERGRLPSPVPAPETRQT